jgi:hypothetical protein
MPTINSQRKAVEFYTIQISQHDNGVIFFEVIAVSVDEEEPGLLWQEVASERATSLESALESIGNLLLRQTA